MMTSPGTPGEIGTETRPLLPTVSSAAPSELESICVLNLPGRRGASLPTVRRLDRKRRRPRSSDHTEPVRSGAGRKRAGEVNARRLLFLVSAVVLVDTV